MASPRFIIDGRKDGVIKESWTTNNRAIAETYAETYSKRYGYALLHKLNRIDNGVAVYTAIKEYKL